MSELKFDAPDAGVWEQDGTHFPRPMTRFAQEAFSEGFVKGFKSGTSRFGLLLDHIKPGFVNGFLYNKAVIVGAPENAKGGPPPKFIFKLICALHPETRQRLKRAATVLQEKPWREHLRHWDNVLKPQSTQNHLRLQAIDLAALTDAQLAEHLRECFENSKAMSYQHHIYTISSIMPVGDFMASVQEWTGLSPSEISGVLKGSTPVSSGITDEYLAALSAINADESAVKILHGVSAPGDVLNQLAALPGDIGRAVKHYLDLVSHRIIGGYDITCLTAIEAPEVIVKALQVKHSPADIARAEQRVAEQTASLRQAVPEALRELFDEILAEARFVNRLRDERSYWSDLWSTGISRRAFLEVGRRLVAQGKIPDAELILDATCEEAIEMLASSGQVPAATVDELARRRQFRVSIGNNVAPPFLNGTPSPPPPVEWFPRSTQRTMRAINVFMAHLFGSSEKKSDATIVRGISVSSGQYEGYARVIERIDDLHLLQKGEVLVTRSTSTAFNFVLPLVGAIVTDRGGLMSHAAIVAREYGLPGVVGCQVAVQTIVNGARVRVDADKGEVILL